MTIDKMKADIKDSRKVYARLAYLFDTATDTERVNGLQWYTEAYTFAQYLSSTYNVTTLQASAIISTLSPAVRWETNKSDAENLIGSLSIGVEPELITVSTYGAQKDKAVRIFRDGNPEHIGNGLKTVSFFCNIYGLHNTSAVTVDRHILGASVGSRSTLHQRISLTEKRYLDISDAIKRLARNRNILPKQAQAVIWETYRNRIGLS